ncbi:MAG: ATP synthase subunit C [Treponema sp.]|jgi:V/A-type H+-transporting ATPase subunit K|nr:ATP synthase subunit C [Treponema sp.]
MKVKVFLLALTLLCLGTLLPAQEPEAGAAQQGTAVWKYFAAALAVGISCIAGGLAVAQIGSAAMGAMSENPELSGKALPYAGLAEGICLWGFLVALLIMIF